MLTLRQSAFDRLETDLFKRLEQQLHTAERVPAAEWNEPEPGTSNSLRLDREAVQAVYRDGLLMVEVPKAQTLTSVSVKVEG